MIYVFKTSCKYKKDVKEIAIEFNKIKQIKEWNFDLEDCDNILRIDTNRKTLKKVYKILSSFNYIYEELQ